MQRARANTSAANFRKRVRRAVFGYLDAGGVELRKVLVLHEDSVTRLK